MHVRVGDLWIHQGELLMSKVWGEGNPADAMTKNVGGQKVTKFVSDCSQEFRAGRADQSLQLKLGSSGC